MSKKYIPNEKEKYMNAKQKAYFKSRLMEWKNEIIEFEKKDFFKQTIKLRKFDEAAKKTDIKMKSIIEYKNLLSSHLL